MTNHELYEIPADGESGLYVSKQLKRRLNFHIPEENFER